MEPAGGSGKSAEEIAQAYKSDVQNAGYAEVVVLEPGETHTP